jgi:hypothetical protein
MAREDHIMAILQASRESILGTLTDVLVFRNWVRTLDEPSQKRVDSFYTEMVSCFEKDQNKGPSEIIVKPTLAIFESTLKNIDSDPESMRIFLRQHEVIEKYISDNESFLKETTEMYNAYLEYVDKDTASVIASLQAAQDVLLRSMVNDPIYIQWAESFDEESQALFREFSNDMLRLLERSTNQERAYASENNKSTVNFRVYPAPETFKLALRNIDSEPNFMINFLRLNVEIKEYLALNADVLNEISSAFDDYLKSLNKDIPMQDAIELSEGSQASTVPENIQAIIQKIAENKEIFHDLKHRFQRLRLLESEVPSAKAQYNDLWTSSDLYTWMRFKPNIKVTIEHFHDDLFEAILRGSDTESQPTKVYLPFTNALSRYIAYNIETGEVQLNNSFALKEYLAHHPQVTDYLLNNLDKLKKCTTVFKHHLDKKQAKKQSGKSEDMHIDSTEKENVHNHKKDKQEDHDMPEVNDYSGPSSPKPKKK